MLYCVNKQGPSLAWHVIEKSFSSEAEALEYCMEQGFIQEEFEILEFDEVDFSSNIDEEPEK